MNFVGKSIMCRCTLCVHRVNVYLKEKCSVPHLFFQHFDHRASLNSGRLSSVLPSFTRRIKLASKHAQLSRGLGKYTRATMEGGRKIKREGALLTRPKLLMNFRLDGLLCLVNARAPIINYEVFDDAFSVYFSLYRFLTRLSTLSLSLFLSPFFECVYNVVLFLTPVRGKFSHTRSLHFIRGIWFFFRMRMKFYYDLFFFYTRG